MVASVSAVTDAVRAADLSRLGDTSSPLVGLLPNLIIAPFRAPTVYLRSATGSDTRQGALEAPGAPVGTEDGACRYTLMEQTAPQRRTVQLSDRQPGDRGGVERARAGNGRARRLRADESL
ncbi:hypothetical protein GCM10010278_79960 [Streptomyces melanogenes]|nr:hypothetical protein GCM10010278_79960 [Streptomyces melanogenes]